MMLHWRPC